MAALTKLWIVRDPTSKTVTEELSDIIYAARTLQSVCQYMIGTGAADFKSENTALYDNEAEALKDAKARLANKSKTAAVASPRDLVARLEGILRKVSTGTPSRARLAAEIKQVAEDMT